MAGPFSRLLLTFFIGQWWLNILPPNLFFRQRPTTGNDSFCRYLVWPHQLLPKQLLAVNPTFQSHISELRCIYGWLAVFCNPRIFLAPATWASPMHPELFSPVTLVVFFLLDFSVCKNKKKSLHLHFICSAVTYKALVDDYWGLSEGFPLRWAPVILSVRPLQGWRVL